MFKSSGSKFSDRVAGLIGVALVVAIVGIFVWDVVTGAKLEF